MVLPLVFSGIPVEVSGKSWWYYQRYIKGITSGIPVEVNGNIGWYYNWFPVENQVFPVAYQWYYQSKSAVKFGGITTVIH